MKKSNQFKNEITRLNSKLIKALAKSNLHDLQIKLEQSMVLFLSETDSAELLEERFNSVYTLLNSLVYQEAVREYVWPLTINARYYRQAYELEIHEHKKYQFEKTLKALNTAVPIDVSDLQQSVVLSEDEIAKCTQEILTIRKTYREHTKVGNIDTITQQDQKRRLYELWAEPTQPTDQSIIINHKPFVNDTIISNQPSSLFISFKKAKQQTVVSIPIINNTKHDNQ